MPAAILARASSSACHDVGLRLGREEGLGSTKKCEASVCLSLSGCLCICRNNIYIYIYIYTHTHIHTHLYTYIHDVCMYIHIHIHIYIYIYMCVYIYIYMYANCEGLLKTRGCAESREREDSAVLALFADIC